jgi:hypothetical protein
MVISVGSNEEDLKKSDPHALCVNLTALSTQVSLSIPRSKIILLSLLPGTNFVTLYYFTVVTARSL